MKMTKTIGHGRFVFPRICLLVSLLPKNFWSMNFSKYYITGLRHNIKVKALFSESMMEIELCVLIRVESQYSLGDFLNNIC